MRKEVFSIRNVSKTANTLLPMERVSLDFYKGEAVSFLGTMNSGISTFADILSGMQQADSGLFFGENGEFNLHSSGDARKQGIYRVRTQTVLFEEFSVLDNVFLLVKDSMARFAMFKQRFNSAKVLFSEQCMQLGLEIDVDQMTYFLSEYQKSMVEVICAVINDAKLIIIDNLLDNCTELEFDNFKLLLKKLTALGVSIAVITSRAQVALNISDRIILVRRGFVTEMPYRHMLNRETVLRMLASAELRTPESLKNSEEKVLLEANGFCVGKETRPFDFTIKKNEVVGFMDHKEPYAGVLYALSGQTAYKGRIFMDGREIGIGSIQAARKWDIGYMSGYHRRQIFYNMTIIENLLLMKYPGVLSFAGHIRKKLVEASMDDFACMLKVSRDFLKRTPEELDAHYQVLIPLMRWIVARPKILLMDVPYRFADVVIANRITEYIDIIKANGTGCVLYSTQASELYDSCNRIYFIDEWKELLAEEYGRDNV